MCKLLHFDVYKKIIEIFHIMINYLSIMHYRCVIQVHDINMRNVHFLFGDEKILFFLCIVFIFGGGYY